jgi:soluble lytic murein transglycosylase-like protein
MAQERARFFDNFDTTRGVQIARTQVSKPVYAQTPAQRSFMKPPLVANTNAGKKLVSKTGQSTPTNKSSRTVQMSPAEGFADREMAGYAASKGSARLTGVSLGSMKGFTTGDTTVDSYIVDSSRRYGIDPLLIYAQMHQESSFKPRATSYKGASGLMQLMPATARRLGVTNIYDPRQNIDGGVKYMRMLLDMFGGNVNLALAGYNAGEGAVMKYGNQIPPYTETREYVRRIGSRYASISDGSFAQNYRRVNNAQAAKLEKKESRPLTVYEPNAVAIRLADGRMRLVNQ